MAERCRHQKIARVGDGFHHGNLEIGRTCGDERKARVFTGGSVDKKARQRRLPRGDPRVFRGNAERKSDGKIAERDRNARPHSFEKPFSAIHDENLPLLYTSNSKRKGASKNAPFSIAQTGEFVKRLTEKIKKQTALR